MKGQVVFIFLPGEETLPGGEILYFFLESYQQNAVMLTVPHIQLSALSKKKDKRLFSF